MAWTNTRNPVKAGQIAKYPTMPEEYHETTISFDHETNEVLFYTTREEVYKALLARHSRPLSSKELNPGYEVLYKASDCKMPTDVLKSGK